MEWSISVRRPHCSPRYILTSSVLDLLYLSSYFSVVMNIYLQVVIRLPTYQFFAEVVAIRCKKISQLPSVAENLLVPIGTWVPTYLKCFVLFSAVNSSVSAVNMFLC